MCNSNKGSFYRGVTEYGVSSGILYEGRLRGIRIPEGGEMNNKIPTNNVKDTVQKYGSNVADFSECL